jgi:GTP cyclohydrolase II
MVDYKKFLGSTAQFNSRRWGRIATESVAFTDAIDGDLAVYFGQPFTTGDPLVRIHSECVFAEALDSDLCDCADQLRMALDRLSQEGDGILLYLRLDGRGAGLAAKVKATALEVAGLDTYDSRVSIGVPPEGRDFRNIGRFLREKGLQSVRLLTNNPIKISGLADEGLHVTAVPLIAPSMNHNVRKLLKTKALRFSHNIPEQRAELPQLSLEFEYAEGENG